MRSWSINTEKTNTVTKNAKVIKGYKIPENSECILIQ